MASNQPFICSERDFALPSPFLEVRRLKRYNLTDIEEQQRTWIPQPYPCLLLPVLLIYQRVHSPWPFLSGQSNYRNPCYSLHPLPNCSMSWLSWSHTYTFRLHPYTFPRPHVPNSTAFAFPSYTSDQSAHYKIVYKEQSKIQVQSSYYNTDKWIILRNIKHYISQWKVIYEI